MVSVFEGQLTRTWTWQYRGNSKKHTINLFHDTITGLRSAMLDYEEIPESIGNSSFFMNNQGHTISFLIEGQYQGYIEIKKHGWTEFTYTCIINDQIIKEVTQILANHQGQEIFKIILDETLLTKSELGDDFITWYLVETTRVTDNVSTFVHRRFRDFAELNSQVKQNFKGHHLRTSLPTFPEKTLKLTTDHLDPAFIEDRRIKLQIYMRCLIDVPHVVDMICVKSFLGIMQQVKEYSYAFLGTKLGIGLTSDSQSLTATGVTLRTAVVSHIINDLDSGGVVQVGDVISRIQGVSVTDMSFNEIVSQLQRAVRPVIVHFIRMLNSNNSSSPIDNNSGSSSSNSSSRVTNSGSSNSNYEVLNNKANSNSQQSSHTNGNTISTNNQNNTVNKATNMYSATHSIGTNNSNAVVENDSIINDEYSESNSIFFNDEKRTVTSKNITVTKTTVINNASTDNSTRKVIIESDDEILMKTPTKNAFVSIAAAPSVINSSTFNMLLSSPSPSSPLLPPLPSSSASSIFDDNTSVLFDTDSILNTSSNTNKNISIVNNTLAKRLFSHQSTTGSNSSNNSNTDTTITYNKSTSTTTIQNSSLSNNDSIHDHTNNNNNSSSMAVVSDIITDMNKCITNVTTTTASTTSFASTTTNVNNISVVSSVADFDLPTNTDANANTLLSAITDGLEEISLDNNNNIIDSNNSNNTIIPTTTLIDKTAQSIPLILSSSSSPPTAPSSTVSSNKNDPNILTTTTAIAKVEKETDLFFESLADINTNTTGATNTAHNLNENIKYTIIDPFSNTSSDVTNNKNTNIIFPTVTSHIIDPLVIGGDDLQTVDINNTTSAENITKTPANLNKTININTTPAVATTAHATEEDEATDKTTTSVNNNNTNNNTTSNSLFDDDDDGDISIGNSIAAAYNTVTSSSSGKNIISNNGSIHFDKKNSLFDDDDDTNINNASF